MLKSITGLSPALNSLVPIEWQEGEGVVYTWVEKGAVRVAVENNAIALARSK